MDHVGDMIVISHSQLSSRSIISTDSEIYFISSVF